MVEAREAEAVFVRAALGPNEGAGLEVVRLGELREEGGAGVVRARARYDPRQDGGASRSAFADPVVLLRAPVGLAFAYGDGRGRWTDRWLGEEELPAVVRFVITDLQRGSVVTGATRLHADGQPLRIDPVPIADETKPGGKP